MQQKILGGMAVALGFALLEHGPCAAAALGAETNLSLATNGRTDYRIVQPADPSRVDRYAVRELAGYLQQITGTAFPVVTPEALDAGSPSIFVGLSLPAGQHLGNAPLDELADQEHVARSIGRDIFLYGKGVHGNLYAVFEFLENSLDWRWFSVFEHPVIPSRPTVVLEPFNRKAGMSFSFRMVNIRRGMDFYYQNGINEGFSSRIQAIAARDGKNSVTNLSHFVSRIPQIGFGHSLHLYIPPNPSAAKREFNWLTRTNYFETNPEFFTMGENGKRVPDKQLCFANPGLRKELTANILRHIQLSGEDVIVVLGANDNPGHFCYCPECKALETRYGSPGGQETPAAQGPERLRRFPRRSAQPGSGAGRPGHPGEEERRSVREAIGR
jgi:hypothetical protein